MSRLNGQCGFFACFFRARARLHFASSRSTSSFETVEHLADGIVEPLSVRVAGHVRCWQSFHGTCGTRLVNAALPGGRCQSGEQMKEKGFHGGGWTYNRCWPGWQNGMLVQISKGNKTNEEYLCRQPQLWRDGRGHPCAICSPRNRWTS